MSLFVGIDGGGTQTTAVVTRADGAVLARVEGGAGRVNLLEPAAGAAALADLTRSALLQAGGAPVADALCCALSGAGREPERTQLEDALRATSVANTVVVVGDFEAGLQDALGSGPGILLISGTGSAAWGRAEDGRQARCGGWGYQIGDEGSGYSIGMAAVRAAMQDYDGRAGDTQLLAYVMRVAGLDDEPGLVRWAAHASRGDIAALAPTVVLLAATDTTAAGIVEQAARELALHIAALHKRLGPWTSPTPVALTGGLIAPGRPLRPHLVISLAEWELEVGLLDREVDGARGAAALAQFAVAQ